MTARAPADHLRTEGPGERFLTGGVAALSILGLLAYLTWRVAETRSGAYLPLWAVLFAAELAYGLRHVLLVWPAVRYPVSANVEVPHSVPEVDVVVMVGSESLIQIRVCILSCRHVRGQTGLVVVSDQSRADVVALCSRLGVRHIDAAKHPDFGSEPNRQAPLVALVPALAWASPDLAVIANPAFEDRRVGSVTAASPSLGVVKSLFASNGYQPLVDRDERLAARLSSVGASLPLAGPVIFRRRALQSIGGIDWSARRPILASQVNLQDRGWRAEFINPPTSQRMAPADERATLDERMRLIAGWREIATQRVHHPPGDGERGGRTIVATFALALLDPAMAVVRLAVFASMIGASLSSQRPVGGEPLLVAGVAAAWLLFAYAARSRVQARRDPPFMTMRAGMKTLGVDLVGLFSRQNGHKRHIGIQNLCLTVLLLGTAAALWALSSGTASEPDRATEAVLSLVMVGMVFLIRDATVAYRQDRILPRITYDSRGEGDVIGVSPLGIDVAGTVAIGSKLDTELKIPLPGGEIWAANAVGVVKSHGDTDDGCTSYIEFESDEKRFDQLLYFCAVTYPNLAWHQRELRIASQPTPNERSTSQKPVRV